MININCHYVKIRNIKCYVIHGFKIEFENKEYKNGCVISNWTTEGFIELYQNIKTTSESVIELIEIELKK